MIDYLAESAMESFEYLAHNSLELVIIGVAFCFSKSKMLPGFLIAYVSIMTIAFGNNQDYLQVIERAGSSWSYYNKEVAYVYLNEAFVMILLSVTSLFVTSKLRATASIIVFLQSSLSLVIGICFYAYAVEIIDLPQWLLSVHYSMQTLFVILYCVIAWMCVYYSRKMGDER